MDASEVRILVRQMLWDWERDHLDDKDCPKCKASCTMVRVSVQPDNPKEDEEAFVDKWRCLNCLGVFTEELKPVE